MGIKGHLVHITYAQTRSCPFTGAEVMLSFSIIITGPNQSEELIQQMMIKDIILHSVNAREKTELQRVSSSWCHIPVPVLSNISGNSLKLTLKSSISRNIYAQRQVPKKTNDVAEASVPQCWASLAAQELICSAGEPLPRVSGHTHRFVPLLPCFHPPMTNLSDFSTMVYRQTFKKTHCQLQYMAATCQWQGMRVLKPPRKNRRLWELIRDTVFPTFSCIQLTAT